MNDISVRRFCLRILVFLIAALFLSSFRSHLWLNSYQFESAFLGWLSPAALLDSFENDISRIAHLDTSVYKPDNHAKPKYLGVASSITILSLPTRLDRRRDMDSLRHLLGVPESAWKYADAVSSTDNRILPVLEWVQRVRSTLKTSVPKIRFSWPDEKEIDRLVKSDAVLELWDTFSWASPFGMDLGSPSDSGSSTNGNANIPFVPCMIKDFSFPFSRSLDQSTTIRPHRILTPARVACWYSHLEAIQRIANSPIQAEEEDIAVILEDDVDVESDITEQLGVLWADLPRDWDIVFLGHCWSNESYHPPLSVNQLHNLHRSRRPQCTHAYVLSRPGARRILSYLRHPPFAFSRAIDQALAWLVESGRIKAFSIVPSLVVQRKVRESDITGRKGGKGSKWKETLRMGLLESVLGKD